MSEKLKPYNEAASCEKCGCGDVSSQYRAKGESGGFSVADLFRRDHERIIRTCRRCRYEWDEAPLSPAEAP